MRDIPDASIDLICTDLPYGTTQAKYDSVIPFAPLWEQYKRIAKPNAAIVLTASQPFTSALVMSNPEMFRYELIWKKERATGHLNCDDKPLKAHESICVFYKKQPIYNPQMRKGAIHPRGTYRASAPSEVYGTFDKRSKKWNDEYFPISVIEINTDRDVYHCAQKPVALLSYLIRTYSNPGDLVLDSCAGSGTTGVACIQTGRSFIGIEKDAAYFTIAKRRLEGAQPPLFTEQDQDHQTNPPRGKHRRQHVSGM